MGRRRGAHKNQCSESQCGAECRATRTDTTRWRPNRGSNRRRRCDCPAVGPRSGHRRTDAPRQSSCQTRPWSTMQAAHTEACRLVRGASSRCGRGIPRDDDGGMGAGHADSDQDGVGAGNLGCCQPPVRCPGRRSTKQTIRTRVAVYAAPLQRSQTVRQCGGTRRASVSAAALIPPLTRRRRGAAAAMTAMRDVNDGGNRSDGATMTSSVT